MESTTEFEKLLFLWGSRTVPLIFEKFNEGCRDFAKMIPGELAIN